MLRPALALSRSFTLTQACSIGLNSGEYCGSHKSSIPACSSNFRTCVAGCGRRLSGIRTLPRAERDTSVRLLPPWGSRMGAGHLGRDAAFIQEHQPFYRKGAHLLAISPALGGHLGPLLLGRPKSLFSAAA